VAGFRSFGPKSVAVELSDDLTTVIGPNSSGKTALLQAFGKLFGVTRAQRTVQRSDFHIPADVESNDRTTRELFVDILIALPELVDGNATPETIAPSFRHMRIERPGEAPVCRMRLEARWEDDGTAEGEVTQELFWVGSLDKAVRDEDKHTVAPADRGLIQLYYTPASRDAGAQIRATTGALASRLLRSIEWSETTQTSIEDASEKLSDAFKSEDAIKAIGEALSTRWRDLHDDVIDTNPGLSLVGRRFEEVVSHIDVVFQQGPQGIERGLDALSEGQQSLFYFALAAAVFDLERKVIAEKVDGFRTDDLTIPALTIFALEEPENHLSPYYLARIVRQVRSLLDEGRAQAIVTSHSPAVLSRVEPDGVRYCRCDAKNRTTSVKAIMLPQDGAEAVKFVRGAMMAFPELYFARFAILVEGDSERIVLPRLAEALGLLVDPAFVAITPLGGRHVQHFWRLLTDLGIPHATLLDLDLGRTGGGFGRVKVAIQNLLAIGVDKSKLVATTTGQLSDKQIADMHNWKIENLDSWVDHLRKFSVCFSGPVDLDMLMLSAFPDAYAAIIPAGGGPELTIEEAAIVVLKNKGDGLAHYTGALAPIRELMPAYRYHFLTHSKPASHLQALTHVNRRALRNGMPALLKKLLEHVGNKLRRD